MDQSIVKSQAHHRYSASDQSEISVGLTMPGIFVMLSDLADRCVFRVQVTRLYVTAFEDYTTIFERRRESCGVQYKPLTVQVTFPYRHDRHTTTVGLPHGCRYEVTTTTTLDVVEQLEVLDA